jgi:hypothetical protein
VALIVKKDIASNLVNICFSGVADFGYDLYLVAIAKLLHGQYFRLLDFYFHTLIQQRRFSFFVGIMLNLDHILYLL